MSARTEHQRSRGPAGGRLSLASLERLPAEIARPAYDAAHLGCGIVHLGIGAFHRAHQAFYTDAALAAAGGAWGIVGASLRGAGVRDRLAAQDCLYTVVEKSGAGARCRVIGAVRQVVFAREDRARLPVLIADRRTRIVSLTITEKGYCQDPATGRLDAAHPDIAHDIAQLDAPISAVGVLVCGLKQRFRNGGAPVTLLCCDNLPHNGRTLRGIVLELAARVEPDAACSRHCSSRR